jgi:hypothetical protein
MRWFTIQKEKAFKEQNKEGLNTSVSVLLVPFSIHTITVVTHRMMRITQPHGTER